eukprot:7166744-Pyramimonas_sp.AAC.1
MQRSKSAKVLMDASSLPAPAEIALNPSLLKEELAERAEKGSRAVWGECCEALRAEKWAEAKAAKRKVEVRNPIQGTGATIYYYIFNYCIIIYVHPCRYWHRRTRKMK